MTADAPAGLERQLPSGPDAHTSPLPTRDFGRGRTPAAWRAVGLGTIVALVVLVPTLAVAEDWHGYPLIDHHGDGWVVAMLIGLAGYLAGGLIAGWRARIAPAVRRALALVTATVVVLVPADLLRRTSHAKNFITADVVRLWVEAVGAALVVTVAGALLSRSVASRSVASRSVASRSVASGPVAGRGDASRADARRPSEPRPEGTPTGSC